MTRVALLWHMHQPYYEDLATGEHILPWVRLHALKDYWGMVALLNEFPSMRLTFNLVPSLLIQLESFAADTALDRHLQLGLKPAEALTEDERAFCLDEFFHAHQPRMIDPHARFAELRDKRDLDRHISGGPSRAARFSIEDFRDLQVWHKLVWIDQYYWEGDDRIRALVDKARHFSEEDKQTLRTVELEILRRVIPEYRQAADRGQVELSTSPFYHAILPLLCDTDIYRRTHPYSRMPREPFRWPGDAAEHLARAVSLHERLFDRRPDGLWPSEGSVSDAILPLVTAAGFRWMATDESILARTLGRGFSRTGDGQPEEPEWIYRAYRVGAEGQQLTCAFRDHLLSDLIGFTYASWPAQAATDDFVGRLVEAGRRYAARTGGAEATVFIILDGENAWEHFDRQGRPFLRALYHGLTTHPELTPVTMSDACATASEALPTIFPGSWIDGNFYIWIGHPDDHRAWSQLGDARRALEQATDAPSDAREKAFEELLIAEGSDWFWWYGDDHSSEHDRTFDELFRRHVANVYRALRQPVPGELALTNITTQAAPCEIRPPSAFIRPTLDGNVSSYFEWIGAGVVDSRRSGDAMHEVTPRAASLSRVWFGFDAEHLYVRVDAGQAVDTLLGSGCVLSLCFLNPSGLVATIGHDGRGESARLVLARTSPPGDALSSEGEVPLVAAGQILELRLPFVYLARRPGDELTFVVRLSRDGQELDHLPRHQPLAIRVPGAHFRAYDWSA